MQNSAENMSCFMNLRRVMKLFCPCLSGKVQRVQRRARTGPALSRRPRVRAILPHLLRCAWCIDSAGWVYRPLRPKSSCFQTRTMFEIDATGATSGLARTLFKLDIYQRAIENKITLRPIHFFQEEKYRSETVRTNVDFESNQLTGLREKIPSNYPDMPKIFKFSPVFDMAGALIWVRSQPLVEGETESIVVWASNAPYLATVTVLGRDTIKVNGHEERAIKLDLKLNGMDNKMHLKEYKLFKGGRGWLSDDAKRIPLRIEADIFIGYVFAELESVQIE